MEHLCNSCQLEKLGKIYFFHFKYLSTSVFEKIRCDLWRFIPDLSN